MNREELLSKLTDLKPALGSRSSVPGFSHVWFDKDHVATFNGGLGIRLEYETGLEFGVPGGLLMDLLSSSSAEEVTLEPSDKGLQVKQGRSITKLQVLKMDENPWNFPLSVDVPAKPKAAKGKKNGEAPAGEIIELPLSEKLLHSLRRALVLKAKNPNVVEEHGVVVCPNDKGLTLFTTTSDVLLCADVDDAKMPSNSQAIVLPRAFVEQVLQVDTEGAKLLITPTHLRLEAPGLLVCSNALDTSEMRDLPAFRKNLSKETGEPVDIPDGMREAIRRALILAGDDESDLKMVAVSKKKQLSLAGRYKQGHLDETFELSGKLDGEVTARASDIQPALGESNLFAFSPKLVSFHGDDIEIFVGGIGR